MIPPTDSDEVLGDMLALSRTSTPSFHDPCLTIATLLKMANYIGLAFLTKDIPSVENGYRVDIPYL